MDIVTPLNTEQSPDRTLIVIQEYQEYQAQIGKAYPAEFVSNLARESFDIFSEWLKIKDAPQELIDLMDNMIVLDRAGIALRNGNLGDWDARALVEIIPQTLKHIQDTKKKRK